MWHRVDLVRTYITEHHFASTFRVEGARKRKIPFLACRFVLPWKCRRNVPSKRQSVLTWPAWRHASNPSCNILRQLQSQSQSQFTTDGPSVSMSWCRAPSGAHGQIVVNCLTVAVLSCSCALSDERSVRQLPARLFSTYAKPPSSTRLLYPSLSLPFSYN
jgi:hypothetical protein